LGPFESKIGLVTYYNCCCGPGPWHGEVPPRVKSKSGAPFWRKMPPPFEFHWSEIPGHFANWRDTGTDV